MIERQPASFGQEQMWLLDRLEGAGAAYNVPIVVRVSGRLEPPALRAALRQLAARHEALRTTLRFDAGRVEQVVHPAAQSEPTLEVVEHAATGWAADAEARARVPFRLDDLPLVRFVLYRLAPDDHVLLVIGHHVVIDGWSQQVLLDDLCRLYDAVASGHPGQADELPVQYADYAVWQREQIDALRERHGPWWRAQLGASPLSIDLPVDRRRGAARSWTGGRVTADLPPALAAALDRLARAWRTTRTSLVTVAFGLLLSRLSGAREVVVGVPVAGRTHQELDSLIGYFVNTLPIPVRGEPGASFARLVEAYDRLWAEASLHADLPLSAIVETLPPGAGTLSAVCAVEHGAPSAQGTLRWTADPHALHTGTAKFDLTLSVDVGSSGGVARLEYRSEAFEAATASAWLGQFLRLLESAVSAPDQAADRLAAMDEATAAEVLAFGAPGGSPGSAGHSVPAVFAARVAGSPSAPALTAGEQHLSYAEVQRRATRLARALQARGVGAEARVALLLDRTVDLPVAQLAVLLAGAAYVPLDPTLPEARLRFLLDDAAPLAVLAHERHLAVLPGEWRDRAMCPGEDAGADADQGHDAALPDVAPGMLAALLYTSGSTGTPKAVAVTHGNIVALVDGLAAMRPGPGDVTLLASAISFDAATFELWGAWLTGAHCCIAPSAQLSIGDLESLVTRHGVTVLWLTAAYFNLVVDAAPEVLARVGRVATGGEALSVAHVVRAQAACPGTQFFNGYGPTETTTFACCWPIPRGVTEAWPSIPLGRPLPHVRLHVVDERGTPVPPTQPGELLIGGAGVTRGYWRRPGPTAAAFRPSPLGPPGERVYDTGDRVRWRSNGTLEFLGRRDGQVKLRGLRVELGEVEAALRDLPEVADAAVVLAEDANGERRLVAYVRPTGSARPEASAVIQLLARRLPSYMVPSSLTWLDDLPRSAQGKVDRRALPAPADTASADPDPPATPTERVVAAIWAELLGRPVVSRRATFFALGGHSLLAARMVFRLHHELGIDLPLSAVHTHGTVAGLAALAAGATAEPVPTSTPLRPRPRAVPAGAAPEALPASFGQEQMFLLDRFEGAGAAYNVPTLLHVRGPLDVGRLEAGIRALLARHEVLRTTLALVEGRVLQQVHALPGPGCPAQWLEMVPNARVPDWEGDARRRAAEPFALDRLPLVRFTLYRLAPDHHVLLLVAHHAVVDGWSLRIVLDELRAACGDLPPPPPLTVQYADYSLWQRERAEHLGAAAEAFWRELLAPGSKADWPRLAAGRDAGSHGQWQAGRVATSWGDDLTAALDRLAREAGTTRATVLTAFAGAWFAGLVQRTRVLVAVPSAGRTRPELAPLVGYFVNTLPLPVDVTGGPRVIDLVRGVDRTLQELRRHEDVHLLRILESLRASRPGLDLPLPLLCACDEAPASATGRLDWRIEPMSTEATAGKFDVSLGMVDHGRRIEASLEFRAAVFDRPAAGRALEAFGRFVRRALEVPSAPVEAVTERSSPPLAVESGSGGAAGAHPPRTSAAPFATDTERRVAAIWRDLLGRDVPSRESDFFALGGHSLLAARLAHELRRQLGVELPLHVLDRARTVTALAALADRAQLGQTGGVVTLRDAGDASPRLYLPYSPGGDVFDKTALAAALPAELTLCGLLPPAGDGRRDTIEEMAAGLVRALVGDGRPLVHLAGYSFSGFLAYEVARQFQACGGQVGALVLIDCGPGAPPTWRTRLRNGWRFLRNLPFWVVDDLATSSPAAFAARARRKLRSLRLSFETHQSAASRAAAVVRNLYDEHVLPPQYEETVRHNLEALFHYQPKPYPGRALLVRASASPLFHSLERDLGWGPLVSDLDVRVVRANHDDIMRPARVDAVAAAIAEEIGRWR